jgi:acyl-CoA thioesterase FadM
MHMLIRFLWLWLRRNSLPRASVGETTEISMRVLPIDLDFLLHMNNGVYFSFLDFGRMDMIFRNGVYALSRQRGWYSVVALETMKFKKSLELWQKFTIRTKIIGYDDKYFFIRQQFIRKDVIMAEGLIRIRFLKLTGGGVPTSEILEAMDSSIQNEAGNLSSDWAQFEKTYL